jgi:Xaa-Pro aminopeptidase
LQNNSGSEIYKQRQADFSSRLKREGIFASVISDFENSRNSSLRYLSGHPMDSMLILFADGESVLIPWDVNLAKQLSHTTFIKPFTDFNRNFILALKNTAEKKLNSESGKKLHALNTLNTSSKNKNGDGNKPIIELSASTSYPLVKEFETIMKSFHIQCVEKGADSYIGSKRILKDDDEIRALKKAASITDLVFLKLETLLKDSSGITETDIALFIETEGRKLGAEGTGFETLVASPERSFSIHPFPSYSDKAVPGEGLTIIDFGLKYSGYTSDVTTTIASGKLKEGQKKMLSLVSEAAEIFENILAPGLSTVELTTAVTSFFEKNGFLMPHALGHGIGLDVHESPILKNLKETESILKPGMVLAIEPGIYSPDHGGVRLENDYLITKNGFEKLTNSHIIRL